MKNCYYVGVVSIPTAPVQAACVVHMCKAGPYFRLSALLLSVCSSWAPDRAEPPRCVPHLQAALEFRISCFRHVKKNCRNSTSPGAPA